jgi:hypothetical protein
LVKDRIFINHKSPGVSVVDAQARLHLPSIPKIKPRLKGILCPLAWALAWGLINFLKGVQNVSFHRHRHTH